MHLFSWNVNGIRAVLKKGALQQFLAEYQPDVLCLQETKATQEQATAAPTGDYASFSAATAGYHQYWNSANKPGYSGTAIFSKHKPLQVLNGFTDDIAQKYHLAGDPYGDPAREGRVLSAEFDDFWVVTVYTPNSKDDLSRLGLRHQQWDPAFLEHVKELEKTKPVLFCGDLNVAHAEIDLANPKANVGKHGFTTEERAGFDAFEAAGFIDTFRTLHPHQADAYTWWSHWANARARNVGWRIDYWLASRGLQNDLASAAIHPQVLGSDHCPVSVKIG